MTGRRSRRRRRKNRKSIWGMISIVAAVIFGTAVCAWIITEKKSDLPEPDELLLTYMGCIQEQKYEEMYQMIDAEASGQVKEEDFIKRNSAIYEGIEIQNMTTTILSYDEETPSGYFFMQSNKKEKKYAVQY